MPTGSLVEASRNLVLLHGAVGGLDDTLFILAAGAGLALVCFFCYVIRSEDQEPAPAKEPDSDRPG